MEDAEVFTYAVIGGGIAGVTCAEHLYILDPEARTVVITASGLIKAVTNVLPITKTLDMFDVEERSPEQLENECPNITVVKEPVTRLNAGDQIIYTTSGRKFSYKKLCICSGGTPKLISNNHPSVLGIRDTESAQQFQERLGKAQRILIVGNGGIATEMVYEVTGVDIIWAVKDKHTSATFIDPGAAEFFKPELGKDKIESNQPLKRRKYTVDGSQTQYGHIGGALGPDWHSGLRLSSDLKRKVTIEYQVEVKNIFSHEELINSGKSCCKLKEEPLDSIWPVYVELSNNKIYGCDFIVSATGVVPNISVFQDGNNLRLGSDGGLRINESMETSLSNVYAAGDVCSPSWEPAQHWFQMRLWTQARHMGSYAAKCMYSSLANEEIYMDFAFELFSHATKFFGYKVIILGLFNGQKLEGKYEILLRFTPGLEYIKCVMADGKMQGAILIGETDLEETFENLILNQMDLSQYGEDLLNPDIDIEDYFD